jgi:glucan 1,3-beta-glucosidase
MQLMPPVPHVRGVNLGGWLVLEPWITPRLFEQYGNASTVDEWTLCEHLGRHRAHQVLEQHRATFVTADELQQLRRSGITHVRIPVGYWAVDIEYNEPFVFGAWEHVLRVVRLAGELGLKVLVDLHDVPGSQNGFDNSGRRGPIEWHAQPSNVQRTLHVLDRMAASLAHPDVQPHVWGIQLVNEPAPWGLDMALLRQFYLDGYEVVRRHLPADRVAVVVHDAFLGAQAWKGFMLPPRYENVVLDVHLYHVFTEDELVCTPEQHVEHAYNVHMDTDLWTIVGEWSLATTDCARYLNGLGLGSRWDGTHPSRVGKGPIRPNATCASPQGDEQFLRAFYTAQTTAYERVNGWFFWNFRADDVEWSYLDILKRAIVP